MPKVIIYLDEDSLAAAKEAASRSKMSVSKWFAQFADTERLRPAQSWSSFFAEIDRFGQTAQAEGWDELLRDRYHGLGDVSERESPWSRI